MSEGFYKKLMNSNWWWQFCASNLFKLSAEAYQHFKIDIFKKLMDSEEGGGSSSQGTQVKESD